MLELLAYSSRTSRMSPLWKQVWLIACIVSSLSAAQQSPKSSTLTVRAALIDKDLNVKPIPRLLLQIHHLDGSGSVLDTKTDLDGSVRLPLSPGRYRLQSVRAVTYQGKSYSWNVECLVDETNRSCELANDNAVVVAAPQEPVNASEGLRLAGPAPPTAQFTEVGVYYAKGSEWIELLPEVVNWKTGGTIKSLATAGIVKKDVNGNIAGLHSRNWLTTPFEFRIYTTEGASITEYQLLRLRPNEGNYREFRIVTGGVFNQRSGAMRDILPFESKRVGNRLHSILLPDKVEPGEYGFICLGQTGGAGSLTSLSMGKMYTFRVPGPLDLP